MKRLGILLALLLLLSGCACSNVQQEPAPGQAATTLRYYLIGNQDNRVRTQVQQAVSDYVEPKLGARVEFVLVSWGDWDAKALTALQAGEHADIFFTADWKGYARSVMQGAFLPLNDDEGEHGNLLAQYGQKITSSLNPAFLEGTRINGYNYAVPTNKELCVPQGYLINADAAQEVGLDPQSIRTAWDLSLIHI